MRVNTRKYCLLAAAFIALGGCGKQNGEGHSKETIKPPAQAATPEKQATIAQWRQSIEATFTKNNSKSDDEGVESFNACFVKDATDACAVSLSGKRDAFRKLQHFTEPIMDKAAIYSAEPAIRAYIALRDCKSPNVFINSIYRGSSWIFMNRIAVMAGGEVVLDREIGSTDTDNGARWVLEDGSIVLTGDEITAIRAVPTSEKVIVRLTGKKGYETLDKKHTDAFKQGLAKVLTAYDSLERASTSVGPTSCEPTK